MSKKVVSAAVTPLLENGSLDKTGMSNLIERGVRHGIDGMFLFGSMGEWGSFSARFKEEAVEYACACNKKRLELMVGITATSLPLSMELMKAYSKYDFGAYVYMLSGKTYHRDPVKTVLEVLDAADRPVYFYYAPGASGVPFGLAQFDAIMAHPNLKGIKNSSSAMVLRRELLLLKREKGYKTLLFEGQEWSCDEALMIGLDGIISGMGALASAMFRQLADCVDRGDFPGATAMQEKLIDLYHGVYGPDLSTVWVGQKYALKKLGVFTSDYTVTQDPALLTPPVRERIEKCIAKYASLLE